MDDSDLLIVAAVGIGALLFLPSLLGDGQVVDPVTGLPPGGATDGWGMPGPAIGQPPNNNTRSVSGVLGQGAALAGSLAAGPVGVAALIGGQAYRGLTATPIEDVPLAVRIKQVQAAKGNNTYEHFLGGQSVDGAPKNVSLNELLAPGGKTVDGVNYSAGLIPGVNGGKDSAFVARDHRAAKTGGLRSSYVSPYGSSSYVLADKTGR